MPRAIDRLIINSPYDEPSQYWSYDRETRTFNLKAGRRPAGFVRASEKSKAFDDPGIFVPLELPNAIRPRVKAWREAGLSRRDRDHEAAAGALARQDAAQYPFFFCQLEAIETLIWLSEAPAAERQGIVVPGDGGEFQRLCSKMATGSGKTIVMAMLIAWQVLNKVAYPQDKRFSKNVFVVAPGLTVKSRLSVLQPSGPGNFYDEFDVVPEGLRDRLRQGRVLVRNWHFLMPLDPDGGTPGRQEGAGERRGVHAARARRHGRGELDPRHQRRGPPRLASRAQVHREGSPKGGHRGSDSLGRRARPHPQDARDPRLLRLLGHALRADREEERRGDALRLDRQRLRPERRDRVRPRQDAARSSSVTTVGSARTTSPASTTSTWTPRSRTT